eukprot:PITA_11137
MYIHREWFKTYKSINDGVVYMGNDVTCNIVGIGSIQLQMFAETTKILTDVRHAPELRKNLISLGALDTNGYKTVIQGGVMKIYKGILLVMKPKKVGNIFQLEGRTESDHVSTVSKNDSSSIRLWNQRLGHMSERGLKILSDYADHEEVPTYNNQQIVEVPEISLRRSTRIKRPPKRYDNYVTSIALTANDDEPLCYQEAVEGSKSEKWKEAMKDEMMALIKNGTWDLVELPKDRKTVGCKWVYKLKRGVD